MAIVYPQAQDPRLQSVQMPMQVNAPVAPSQASGLGLSREQIMMALQSQNPLLAAASDRALANEREQIRKQAQETQQRQAQEAMEASQQADAAMASALPSDAEMTVAMNEGGFVRDAQIRYPHTENPRFPASQLPVSVNRPLPRYPSGQVDFTDQVIREFYNKGSLFGPILDFTLRPQSERINEFFRQNQRQQRDAAREARALSREQAQASAPAPSMVEVLPSDAEVPVAMKEGGLVKQAQKVQQQGRNGDSMLVHMNPDEYRAMTALGGLGGLAANQVTINPETGLPEMFSFKDVLPTIVGIAGAAFGLPTWAVALGTGATTAITTGDIGKGLMAGLGSYALGSLFEGFGAGAANQGVEAATQQAIAANAPAQLGGQTAANLGATSAAGAQTLSTPFGGQMLQSSVPMSGPFALNPADLGVSQTLTPQLSTSAGQIAVQGGQSMIPGLNPAGALTSSGARSAAERAIGGLSNTRFAAAASPKQFGALARPVSGALPINEPFVRNLSSQITGLNPADAASVASKELGTQLYRSAPAFSSDIAGYPTKLELISEGISNIGTPAGMSYMDVAKKGGLGALGMAGSMGAFDAPEYDYSGMSSGGTMRRYTKPDIAPLDREVSLEGFDASRAGIDPQFQFFAKDGKKGELDTVYAQTGYSDIPMAQQGMSQPQMVQNPMMPQAGPQAAQMQSAIMQAAREVASNSAPQTAAAPRPRTIGLTPNAAANAVFGMNQNVRMQEGGVPSEAMMAQQGIMDVASDQVKNNLKERMSVMPSADQPQNVEERAIYDRAMLAVQGMLEPEEAQMAVEEFIETFGAEAYNMIKELARNPRDEGGVVKPANGNTTVADGAMQGEDIIAGKIVDPDTGEETANLRVGENEYIEPADSLSRRAMAAGLPGTPENGARVRGMEEEQLRQAFG